MHDAFGSLFLDPVFWRFKYARDGADRLMGDLDVETRRTFVTLSKNSLAGQPRSIQSVIILLNALSKAIFMRSTYLRALPD